MHKYIAYENAFLDLGQADVSTFGSLLQMSQEIKESLGLPYQPIRIEADSKVYIERVVGNISHGDVNLVILPKVSNYSSEDETPQAQEIIKGFMLRTLRCVGDRLDSTIFFTKSNLVDDQGLFLEVLAKYYLESLTKARRLMSVATYRSYESRVSSVKGRVLVHKQLSEPMTDAKIWCRYKRISEDNAINALLIWACRFLAESVEDLVLRKKLMLLMQEFDSVSVELTYQTVSSLSLPRQFNSYKECFSIAKNLFLGRIGKKEIGGGNRVCGYVISTERAFERIVEAYCGRAANRLGYAHRAQVVTRLAKSSLRRELDYYIIPDDLVFTNEKRLVVDAKYKLLRREGSVNKPGREDFYQMISSCIAQNAFESVLVYPKAIGSQASSWDVVHQINGETFTVRSAFVDIFGTDAEITEELANAIINTNFHGVRT